MSQQLNKPARTSPTVKGTLVFLLIAGVILIAIVAFVSGEFQVQVTKWSPGSADVSGSIENRTSSGCTDPEVTLHLRDHNDAIVQEFTFGTGELARGEKRSWTTHMVGLLSSEMPAPSNATSITADAACADKH